MDAASRTKHSSTTENLAENEVCRKLTVSAFDNRGTYTHICVYDYTQMPSQLHTIACSSLGAKSYLKLFLGKVLMLKFRPKKCFQDIYVLF